MLSVVAPLLFVWVCCLQAAEASDEVLPPVTLVEQLTAELLGSADAGTPTRSLVEIARERKAALLALMELAPAEALRLALPAATRSSLPAEVQPDLEQDLELEGILAVLIEDFQDPAVVHYTLVVGDQRYSLHFAGPPPSLLSGSRVRIQGLGLDGHVALEANAPTDTKPD